MVKEGGNTLDIHGLENLSAGALIMDAASYAEAADSSVTLGAENISLESIANTKGNARNGKPSTSPFPSATPARQRWKQGRRSLWRAA